MIVLLALIFLVISSANGSISKNLKYHEILHAQNVTHTIVAKRSLQESDHPSNKMKEVQFTTLGKDFRLILNPKHSVLHSKFKAYAVDGNGKETSINIDHENFYEGRVFGESNSKANLHIDEEGVITGAINLPGETYHIEPSWRHLVDLNNKTMITYKGSDIKLSWDNSNFGTDQIGPKTCGFIKEGLELEDDEDDNNVWKALNREKRKIGQNEYKPTKSRCPLLLVADYRFYQEMGANDTKTTVNYLISLIDRVDKIYNDTTWGDGQEMDGFKGMGFVIKKIVVHNEPTQARGDKVHYNMFRDKWDIRNLLEVFSREYSHKDFCLAHLFTDFKFENGVLGLAYIGSPRRKSVGGICTLEYFKSGYTLYLNSGLSSSRNYYGQRVITREADLVTAHELGHNWGSEHDPDSPECSPSASQGGSYLMYKYPVSGYDFNHKRFSPCSLRSIHKVLVTKSGRCFSEPDESFCGNLRVEGDEECDAGLIGTDEIDPCCDKNCKLRRWEGAVCSDKNSLCCKNCQYVSKGVECRKAQHTLCERESYCTGLSAECPRSTPISNGMDCLERGICWAGECIPYCETHGLQSCMCDIIENACKRCCRASVNETCSPIEPADNLPDGTACIQGFCNKGSCENPAQDQDGVERDESRMIVMLRVFLSSPSAAQSLAFEIYYKNLIKSIWVD